MTTPPWWTVDDAARVAAFRAWLAQPWPRSQPYGGWCSCRTCAHWKSAQGVSGRCMIPLTPATLRCGDTREWDLCEQYEPRDLPAAQEVLPHIDR